MNRRKPKFHWLDAVIVIVLIAVFGLIWFRIEGALNYKWRWEIIPNYILRWDEETQSWVANLLLQGLVTTLRVCLYASILALVLGTILGIARCAQNLAIRMIARTYLELLRNIPPVVVIFIFFFFLSEQIITAFNIEGWARAIAKQEKQ